VGCNGEIAGLTQELSAEAGPVREVACGNLLLATDPVKPAQALDYIGVFAAIRPGSPALFRLSDYGDACSSASERAACLAAVAEQLEQPFHCDPEAVFCNPFVITTRGDKVQRHDEPAQLVEILGKIDTHSEAVLLAQLHGLHASCGPSSMTNSGTLVQATSAGYQVQSKWDLCSDSIGAQNIEIRTDGSSAGFQRNFTVRSNCTVGRRPAGLQLSAAGAVREPLAAFLADCARLEAASVPAFRRLARELQHLGAPRLAAAARRSARDEVRHAAQVASLARRYGARVQAPRVAAAQRRRPALEIAQENAVEGCVRETFGALLAWQQAASAKDPVFARVMRGIAADETRHAELSWQVAAFIEPKLSARERLSVARARSAALEQLRRDIAADPLPVAARAHVGWPSHAQQQALLNRLASELRVS
jgi:hypothetical protein